MGRVRLSMPIELPGRVIDEIELRPPGRRVIEAMAQTRLPAGFTDAATIRFAARLSGLSEAALSHIDPADLPAVRSHVEELFEAGRRQEAVRRARKAEQHE